ncbi:hypothetical protein C8R42DRAFT_449008 [Lentinula raphanica]|nr:hypothetical protein C8R42DRAFT_449008 [Lentinula raphanica]
MLRITKNSRDMANLRKPLSSFFMSLTCPHTIIPGTLHASFPASQVFFSSNPWSISTDRYIIHIHLFFCIPLPLLAYFRRLLVSPTSAPLIVH